MKTTDVKALISQSIIEGMIGTCCVFLNARKLEYTNNTLMAFAEKITSEFDKDPAKRKQHLPEPISNSIKEALTQATGNLQALYDNNELTQMVKLIRVIAGGELMILLDRYPGAAIELFHSCEKKLSGGE